VTLAGEPYKGYPSFQVLMNLPMHLKTVDLISWFNANNHALDRGKEGLERTIDVASQKGLIMTGVFESSEERR